MSDPSEILSSDVSNPPELPAPSALPQSLHHYAHRPTQTGTGPRRQQAPPLRRTLSRPDSNHSSSASSSCPPPLIARARHPQQAPDPGSSPRDSRSVSNPTHKPTQERIFPIRSVIHARKEPQINSTSTSSTHPLASAVVSPSFYPLGPPSPSDCLTKPYHHRQQSSSSPGYQYQPFVIDNNFRNSVPLMPTHPGTRALSLSLSHSSSQRDPRSLQTSTKPPEPLELSRLLPTHAVASERRPTSPEDRRTTDDPHQSHLHNTYAQSDQNAARSPVQSSGPKLPGAHVNGAGDTQQPTPPLSPVSPVSYSRSTPAPQSSRLSARPSDALLNLSGLVDFNPPLSSRHSASSSSSAPQASAPDRDQANNHSGLADSPHMPSIRRPETYLSPSPMSATVSQSQASEVSSSQTYVTAPNSDCTPSTIAQASSLAPISEIKSQSDQQTTVQHTTDPETAADRLPANAPREQGDDSRALEPTTRLESASPQLPPQSSPSKPGACTKVNCVHVVDPCKPDSEKPERQAERDLTAEELVPLSASTVNHALTRDNVRTHEESLSSQSTTTQNRRGGKQPADGIKPVAEEKSSDVQNQGGTRVATPTTKSSRSSHLDYMTSRFEHIETDEGFLISTGPTGQIANCEDEPIRVPGAIQSFGVLMAVLIHGHTAPIGSKSGSMASKSLFGDGRSSDISSGLGAQSSSLADQSLSTDEITGESTSSSVSGYPASEELINITRLEVVQVSENSGHVLGLSPKMLLNLHSFTDILTEAEAQVLCDNIEVCMDSAVTSQAGPHTFRLSGSGQLGSGLDGRRSRHSWLCWCAAHRPDPRNRPRLLIIEFELETDTINPPTTTSMEPVADDERGGMAGKPYEPTEEDVIESTKSVTKPLKALARLRKKGKDFSGDSVEVLSILGQVNNEFDQASDMPSFLKMVVGLVRELTGFHRVMIYQFDENWNGQVVAELVDWTRTRDLYRGLIFPASDIPAQARELYKINKVRQLYDRDQPTSRLVCRSAEELKTPLDMTHCHLRAMSPIHIKYLANMGVRASFSISIIMNDELWGLISCHTYGRYGQRVTFPTRYFCRMLGESVSRNIHRLHLSQRLQARKLINTASTSKNPSGYIVAKAEDLLWLFDAEFGVLSIGEEAKLLGAVCNSQEILVVLEYLRVKCFDSIQASTDILKTFPDIYPAGFESICGILLIPLSREGKDFICFFRPSQMKEVHWAGNPHEKVLRHANNMRKLEPRKSFKIWSETVKGQAKPWTEEQMETGSVLSLVYGKFIDVWRQKEAAVQTNQLQTLLLSNASHEVRTPLHQILSTLELALDGHLDEDTRDNLSKSYTASKALVHVINDLLDLTKAEQGGDLLSKDPFHFPTTIEEAVSIHRREAERKGLDFEMIEEPSGSPAVLQGDRGRLRQVISNLVGNAVKHTSHGSIHVKWGEEQPEEGSLRFSEDVVRISISVTDTGKGIPEAKLESIFRAFEQVDAGTTEEGFQNESIGLGLAVVGRVVHNMGGQLRVDSTAGQGSKFTIVLPFTYPNRPSGASVDSYQQTSSEDSIAMGARSGSDELNLVNRNNSKLRLSSKPDSMHSRQPSLSHNSEIDSLVEAIQAPSNKAGSDSCSSPRLFSPFSSGRSRGPRPGSSGSLKDKPRLPISHISGRFEHDFFSQGVNTSILRSPITTRSKNSHESTGSSELVRISSAPSRSNEGSTKTQMDEGETSKDGKTSSNEHLSNGNDRKTPAMTKFNLRQSPLTRVGENEVEKENQQLGQHQRQKDSSTEGAEEQIQDRKLIKEMSLGGGMEIKALGNHPLHVSEYSKPTRVRTVSKEIMKVMVVEDDPINRVILKKKLTQSGHSVSLTVHGQEAVELFEADYSQFDIILMDLQMPICDGMEATRRIREFESKVIQEKHQKELPKSHLVNHGVPIIAVSASLHEKQRTEIEEAGMDGWILKPVDFNRLSILMTSSIDHQLREQEVYQPGQWDKGGWLRSPRKATRG